MGHPDIENETPFVFAPLFMNNEEGRPFVVLLTKATYEIVNDAQLALAEQQDPVSYAGELWGEAGESSYRYEPEVSWPKPATDVVLIGRAWAPAQHATAVDIGFRVGPVTKSARVFGDRAWVKGIGSWKATPARPFEAMPLIYERSFGGVDRSHPDPAQHSFDQRNPVGRGFRAKGSGFEDGILLPNIEDAKKPISSPKDRPAPIGFGFTSHHWMPRASFAGTYDDAWVENRAPLLPEDFDRRFWSAASPGLVAPGYLKGDELVAGVNVTQSGRLSFRLPGVPGPRCRVRFRTGGKDVEAVGRLDTVIVNTDDNKVNLLWRNEVLLREGPHDVAGVHLHADVERASVESPRAGGSPLASGSGPNR